MACRSSYVARLCSAGNCRTLGRPERTHGTFGFAWLALGNAGINMSVPLRLAPFIGVYGLSFVFAVLAVAAATVILRYPRKYLWPLAAVPILYVLPPIANVSRRPRGQ